MKVGAILVDSATEDSDVEGLIRQWNRISRKNMDMVKSPETEITFLVPRVGLTGVEAFSYSYIHHLQYSETLHAAMEAEKEGYDAVMIMCFLDPALRDLRQAVDIPVIGPAEASMLMATMMGSKFGVVTISPEAAFEMEENIARYGLRERAVPIRPIPATPEEQMVAVTDARHEIESFKKVGRELIENGAELLIPGCTVMAPVLRLAIGAEKDYPHGLTEVDGVPVMDVMAATIKMAETLVALKKAGSTWISRKSFYAQATPAALEQGKAVLEYKGPGFRAE